MNAVPLAAHGQGEFQSGYVGPNPCHARLSNKVLGMNVPTFQPCQFGLERCLFPQIDNDKALQVGQFARTLGPLGHGWTLAPGPAPFNPGQISNFTGAHGAALVQFDLGL
jgi:hypothetical protein